MDHRQSLYQTTNPARLQDKNYQQHHLLSEKLLYIVHKLQTLLRLKKADHQNHQDIILI